MRTEDAHHLARIIPAQIAGAWALWGFTLNEWAAIFGILYSSLMIFFLLKDRLSRRKLKRVGLSVIKTSTKGNGL